MFFDVGNGKLLQKVGVKSHVETAKKMRKFKGVEFPRAHRYSYGWAEIIVFRRKS